MLPGFIATKPGKVQKSSFDMTTGAESWDTHASNFIKNRQTIYFRFLENMI